MFYKQFSKITKDLNFDFVQKFDYWLATLPNSSQNSITTSAVSARLGVSYAQADLMLKYSEKLNILQKHYLIRCPECDYILEDIESDELARFLRSVTLYCDECNEERQITSSEIYIAYRVIAKPNITESQFADEVEKHLKMTEEGINGEINFNGADSLENNLTDVYEAFFNPSESAYKNFVDLRNMLDKQCANTTEKGHMLELLALELFRQIKYVSCTNLLHTETNQFDCTALCGVSTIFPSIFKRLTPYFIIECKNEPNKAPDNTYVNKLLAIMETNEAKLGIVLGRKEATAPCFQIAHDHYLKNDKVVITMCDTDLNTIIDDRVNLLKYLEFKVTQVTTNSPRSTFSMFT